MRKLGWVVLAVLSPFALTAATFGPETPVARLQHSSAFGQQEANGIACGDQSCVSLWIEDNDARRGLYSSVVNADGSVQPLSSNVLRLGSAGYASIVWTGDHYLAMWVASEGLVAAPLSRDGRISGAIQTLMTNVPVNSRDTALAWNGRRAFAVFNTPDALWMGILDESGNLVRPVSLQADVNALASQPKLVLPGPSYAVGSFDVAAAGLTFAVTWTETKQYQSSLKAMRYADDGSPLDHAPITLENSWAYGFGIAGNATQFGIAYSLGDGKVHRVRLDAWTGAVYAQATLPFQGWLYGVYWSGDDFVAYGKVDNRTTTFAIETNRFSSNALRLLEVSKGYWIGDIRFVSSTTGAIAVWSEGDEWTQHVFGALVDNDATAVVKGRLQVSVSALPQTAPALAASKSGGLLAWSQYHDGIHGDIVAQRVGAGGAAVGEPIVLAENAVNAVPVAVWTGNDYLVVWSDNGIVVGTRVSSSGVVLDQPPRIFEHGGHQPVLVSNGTFSLLTIVTGQGIEAIRLDADGSTIDILPIKIASTSGTVSAASNGDEFLVAWSWGGVNAVRFTASGQLIDKAPIAIGTGARPAVASDGRDFLIAYSDPRLVTKRLLAVGSLAGSTAQDRGTVVDATGTIITPSIAWDGSSYVVAWSVQYPDGSTVLSTTVDPAGAPIDAPRVLGRNELSFFNVGAAVEAIQGTVVVAYSRGTAAENGIPRVFTREVQTGPPRGRGVHH